MAVEVSSLIALLRGDDDMEPVPNPALVALIINGLATKEDGRWTGGLLSLADYLFGTENIAPKTEQRYVEEIGKEMYDALRAGLDLWHKQSWEKSIKNNTAKRKKAA